MERKNMVLLTVIASATLLVAVVGATFAYFSITVTNNSGAGQTGATNIQSGQVAGSVIVADTDAAAGSFKATNVYPGHKEVADFKIAVTADDTVKTKYAIKYNVTQNTFSEGAIKVSLYSSDEEVAEFGANFFGCTPQTGNAAGATTFYETCTKSETDLTGATLVSGSAKTLAGNTETVDLGTVTVTGDSTKYYYVVVEFVNDEDANQPNDVNKALKGDIDVELVA